uniref:RUN and FYVE domain containing 2 n=1 Tax=Anabas testudineus TaxID=64144 RepID=A0A7N6BWV0_ANATE
MASPAETDLALSEGDSSKERAQVFGILRLQEERSGAGDRASSTGRGGGGGGGGGGGDGRWQAPIFALARKASETISGSIHVLPKVSEGRTSLPGDWTVQALRDPMAMERANLLNMAKLSIKGLIESALSFGRTLDSDYPPLQQFFVVMEHCLKHGLRVKKSFLGFNKSLWGPLELVEKLCPEAAEISASVRDLPGLKTPLGRARAWLRLALMQKRLADYLRLLITRKDLLSDFYENSALMLEEEGAVIVGLLVGLNVIDANLCVKGEDLDSQVGVIDFSMYLKNDIDDYRSEERNSQIASILDQKNYVEELNRQLNDMIHYVKCSFCLQLAIAKNNIIKLQEENQQLRSENTIILLKTQQHLEVTQGDVTVERDTYKQSRQGLDEMYNEARRQLKEECQLRQDVENELVVQVSMKQEMELAMKLLEKDIHEKQDTLIGLRQQLDEVKAINVEMYQKMQVQTGTSSLLLLFLYKSLCSNMFSRLSIYHLYSCYCCCMEILGGSCSQQLETDLKIEREWRQTLQSDLDRERETVAQLSTEALQIIGLKKVRKESETNVQSASYRAGSDSCLHVFCDMDITSMLFQGGQVWLKDKEASHCKLCEKEFSISRRKHHCRNCGEIFCNSCSDNELPLPASPKPVRVCDTCHALLLQRCSSNPT